MSTADSVRMKSTFRTTGLSLGVAAALWLLGRGALSTPPVDSWTQLQRWLGDRSTAEAAIAALRATGSVAACYLGAVSGLALVASIASLDRVDRIARSLIPRSVRPFIGLAVGASVATAAASMTVPRDAAPTHVATVMLEAPTDATATMYIVSESVPATTVVPPALVPATTVTPAPLPALTPAAPPLVPLSTPAAVSPRTWTIARGDHLWAVASETLADAWHRPPSDSEIVPYWHDLIESNRSRLVDATNADFVLAGQVFVLPDVPAPPTSTKPGA
ncbi:MAG: hypothetical protein E6G39_00580 [Actinobacteria bacterium]|nr:MAG: hypothetical protein E6G39_00580 [Actinomycetota bacterium]